MHIILLEWSGHLEEVKECMYVYLWYFVVEVHKKSTLKLLIMHILTCV